MDPATLAVVAKFVIVWIVTYTPTPECIKQDQQTNFVQVYVGKKTDGTLILQNVRKNGIPPPVMEQKQAFTLHDGKGKPKFPSITRNQCYLVTAARVSKARNKVVWDPIAEAAAKKKAAEKARKKARSKKSK